MHLKQEMKRYGAAGARGGAQEEAAGVSRLRPRMRVPVQAATFASPAGVETPASGAGEFWVGGGAQFDGGW